MAESNCPICAERGEAVPGQTVKSLVAVSLRALRSQTYWFCPTRACPVVYFSADGQQLTQAMLRETVYQKMPELPQTPVCYCFAYTVGDVIDLTKLARIVRHIRAGIKANQCACDLRNPQGTCCLGNVLALGAHQMAG